MRSRLYNQLHSLSYVSQLNYGVLVITGSAMVAALAIVYNPGVKVNNTPVFVQYIKAAPDDQPAVAVGKNDHLDVLFSDKEDKTAGATIATEAHGSTFRLSANLLADGLAVPADKQVGDKLVSWHESQSSYGLKAIPVAHAQESNWLPKTAIANVEVETPADRTVVYAIGDLIKMRYDFDEWKIKETITLKSREAIKGNTLKFALNAEGLIFKPATDGSWQAFRLEDGYDVDRATAVFRLYAPTVHDHKGVDGKIAMNIKDNVATYTIDQKYLDQAEFPLTVDPTISQSGRTCTWSNGAGTNVWATAGNWSCTAGNGPPTAGDVVVFDGTSDTAVNAASDSVADDLYSVSLNSGYTSTVTLAAHPIASNEATPDNYKWDLQTLTVNSGNLVLTGDPTVNPAVIPTGCSSSVKCGRGIEIAANTVTVASGASINADGMGFNTEAVKGPGGAALYTGATYGGTGGGNSSGTYGSVTAPSSLGSAAAHSSVGSVGSGGGAIKLTVSGTLTNNGRISANGIAATTLMGSGGSLHVSAGTLAGAGSMSVNGADFSTSGGGGSGGRMAVVATTNSYSGTMAAYGGDGKANNTEYSDGAAGTVYTRFGGQSNGSLIVDNNDRTMDMVQRSYQMPWATLLPAGSYAFDTIALNNEGTLAIGDNNTLDIRNTTISGDGTGVIKHRGTGVLTTNTSLTITGWKLSENTTAIGSVTDLTIGSGGSLTHLPNDTAETYKLNLTFTSLTINSGGSVDVTGKGYAARAYTTNYAGPGAPSTSTGGASHGGLGGTVGGAIYGSNTAPTSLGSSTDIGIGGGAIRLTVSGALTNNGSIVADGSTGTGLAAHSNGSGGSIFINTSTLSGNGIIAARGGNSATNIGAGGGGRMAVYVTGTDNFTGTKSVSGGTSTSGGSYNGSAGTIYSQHLPIVTVTSPANSATNQSQNTVIAFNATDADGDYWRAQVQVSSDNFATSCNFTQSSTTSSFAAGTCSGSYASMSGAFTGMNTQSNSAYTSGSTATFTFSSDLAQGQSYQVRVKAADPNGGAGALAATNGLLLDTNDYVLVDTMDITNKLNIGSSDMTIETWIKQNGSDCRNKLIATYAHAGGQGSYGLSMDCIGRPVYSMSNYSASQIILTAPNTIADGSWHHLAGVRSGSNFYVFVDGQIVAQTTGSVTIPYNQKFWIGGMADSNASVNGMLDEMRVSNIARYTSAFTPNPRSFTNDANTMGLWHFDELSGQTVADSSSYGNNGVFGLNATVESTDPSWTTGKTVQTDEVNYVTAYASVSYTVAPISKLVFTTNGSDTTCTDSSSGQTIVVNQASTIYTTQVCNAIDEAVKVGSNLTVALSSSSGNGKFSATPNGTYTNTLNITIPSGSSGQSFYYKDTGVGTPTITADESPSAGWAAATQVQTLKSDVPVRLGMTISGNPTTVRAGYNSAVTVTAYDQYNNVASDFTGSKTLAFGGANNSNSVISGTTAPTVTNSSNAATAFGTDTAINFTNGISQSRTMILKKVEPVALTVQDSTGGIAGISSNANTLSLAVIPGDLATFSASDYPQAATGQFASAGFPWSTTGTLAAGNQAPYDVTVTAFDGYGNVKYDYEGPLTFTMDDGTVYSMPATYNFTWNQSHTDTTIRANTSSAYDNGKHIFNASDFTVTTSGSALNFHLDGENSVRKTLIIKVKPADIGRIGISLSPSMTTETVGTAFDSDVIVTAYDVLGNVKTDYTGSVYFKSSDPAATLPYIANSKYTFAEENLGVKTFDKAGFSFATGGNHTITVIDADTNRECNPDPTNSNYANCYTDTTAQITVPVHPVTNFAAIAGHQSVTLSWRNPSDPAVTKVSIYRSTTEGVLGTKLPTQPGVSPNVASQYMVNGLSNGTTYYFTVKAVHLDPSGVDAESVASTQVAATPADIAPRDVTASQGSDGRVAITYGLRFPSTVSMSYYLPETDSWTAASAGAMSGDVGAGISGSDSIDSHTAYFIPTVDIPNKYYIPSQGFKMRIDVIAQGSGAQGVSNIILLDTTPPRVNTGESMFIMDATGNDKVKLTLLAREDGATEQAIQYRISNNADMSNATDYTALATKPTVINDWELGDSDTVYAQFKDPYNNITSVSSKLLDVPSAFGIKDASNLDESKYRLVLTWTDPQIANFSQFLIDRSLDNNSWEQIDTTTKDGYINVGLEEGKKYYYRVKTKDTSGNVSRPSTVLSSQPGAAPDVTAKPTIEVQNWKQEYGVRATVKWTTDQLADSFVVYSKKPLKDGSATLTTDGEAAQVVGQFDKTLEHEVLVQQLEPSTKYYFKTLSQNDIKITGASEVVELTTPARIPLSLSGVKFVDTKPNSTTVTWTTNKLSTTVLEYGTTTDYGKAINDKNLNTDHTIPLTDLQDGTTYHVRVNATDADGNTTSSDDYLVQTPATPTLSDVRVSELQANMATITWRTNVNTDSNIEFGTTTAYGSQQGKSDATTLHTVTIIGLEPATTYNYRARSADQFGSVATGSNLTFTTPKDTTAPEVSNIKSEITASGSGDAIKLKAIISWDTNESATSQVEYGVGLSEEYPEKSPETVSFNQSHTVILPDLKANASYQYRIVAKDAAGNISKSETQTLITPPKNKSLLQLVIKSLEETFSWTKRLHESPLIKRFK